MDSHTGWQGLDLGSLVPELKVTTSDHRTVEETLRRRPDLLQLVSSCPDFHLYWMWAASLSGPLTEHPYLGIGAIVISTSSAMSMSTKLLCGTHGWMPQIQRLKTFNQFLHFIFKTQWRHEVIHSAAFVIVKCGNDPSVHCAHWTHCSNTHNGTNCIYRKKWRMFLYAPTAWFPREENICCTSYINYLRT